jgi:hypothetical protein
MFEIPGTTPRTDSPSTIIVKRPIRSGKCDMCGANCEYNFPTVIGVAKSITSPIPHKMNRNGGGISAETIHTIAAHRITILYRRIRGVAEEKDLLTPVRTYSKTRIIRMAAYDRAKPTEPSPRASDTYCQESSTYHLQKY